MSSCPFVTCRYQWTVGRFRSVLARCICSIALLQPSTGDLFVAMEATRGFAIPLESSSGRKLATWHYGIPQMTVTRYGIALSRYMHAHITFPVPPPSSYASRSAEQCAQTNDELSENAFHASYSRMRAYPTNFSFSWYDIFCNLGNVSVNCTNICDISFQRWLK